MNAWENLVAALREIARQHGGERVEEKDVSLNVRREEDGAGGEVVIVMAATTVKLVAQMPEMAAASGRPAGPLCDGDGQGYCNGGVGDGVENTCTCGHSAEARAATTVKVVEGQGT